MVLYHLKWCPRSFNHYKSPLAKKVKITQLDRQQANSLIAPTTPSSLELDIPLDKIATVLRSKKVKNIGPHFRRVVGAVLFCIEKRIAYEGMLLDLSEGDNCRIIHHKKSYFLEYSEELDPQNWNTPVQRHQISYKTARLLEEKKDAKRNVEPRLEKPVPLVLEPLAALLFPNTNYKGITCKALIKRLCEVVNQINPVMFSGIAAAAMSERRPPTSLHLSDYIRLIEGIHKKPLVIEGEAKNTLSFEVFYLKHPVTENKSELHANAKQLISTIYTKLKSYTPSKAPQIASNIEKTVRQFELPVSQTVIMLCFWIASIMKRGKKHMPEGEKYYNQNTLQEYFSQLRHEFRDIGYDLNLLSLSQEKLTSFYEDVLAYKEAKGIDLDYPLKRLIDFHSWAREFGIEEPDWEELDVSNDRRSVRPVLFSPTEIKTIIQQINAQTDIPPTEKLLQQFVFILGYEFGLRRDEALKLTLADIIIIDDEIKGLMVRPNQFRTLKSNNALRVLPFTGTLTAQQRQVFNKVMSRYQVLYPNQSNQPLFSLIDGSESVAFSKANKLVDNLIALMKAVTGSKNSVFHGLRHYKYNLIAAVLFPFKSPLTKIMNRGRNKKQLQETLLGPQNGSSRRTAPAVACFMGHKSISTSLLNYDHLMTDWIDSLRPVRGGSRKLECSENTDEWETFESVQNYCTETESEPADNITLSEVLHTAFLIAKGFTATRLSEHMAISESKCQQLIDTYEKISTSICFKTANNNNVWARVEDNPRALLQKLSSKSWKRIITHIEHIESLDNITIGNGETALTEANMIPIDELPALFNERRLVHLRRESHEVLVRRTMELFSLSNDDIIVKVKGDKPFVSDRMTAIGYEIIHSADFGKLERIPPFPMTIDGYEHHQTEMGLLKLRQNRTGGVIRDSLELAVAIVVTGFWDNWSYHH